MVFVEMRISWYYSIDCFTTHGENITELIIVQIWLIPDSGCGDPFSLCGTSNIEFYVPPPVQEIRNVMFF